MKNYTIQIYHIEVFYDVDFDMSIYSATESKIKPVKLKNGDIDQQALADYDSFADNIYAALCEYFEIVDIDFSDKSDTSRYFYLYAKDKSGSIATKFIIRLRLSDHEYTERHNVDLEKKYVEKRAQELKQPKTKKYQKWKIKKIVVNSSTYPDYDTAEDAICEELEEYSKRMFRKGN